MDATHLAPPPSRAQARLGSKSFPPFSLFREDQEGQESTGDGSRTLQAKV